MKYLIGILYGFVASAIFYYPMHKAGFPELGRYSSGIILIGIAHLSTGGETSDLDVLSPTVLSVGFGVSLARIVLR